MKIKIVLTGDDKVYARKHNLTDSEMRDFIEDMEMADQFEREAICERHRRCTEMLATPQCSVYDAW